MRSALRSLSRACLRRGLAAAALVAATAVPSLADEGRWSFAAPGTGDGDLLAPYARAEITTDAADVALAWLPDPGLWRMFVLHRGWDPSTDRDLVAIYSGADVEILSFEAERAVRNSLGNTDLRFDVPDAFLGHMRGASELTLATEEGLLTVPLSGSSKAISELQAAAAEAPDASPPPGVEAEAEAAGPPPTGERCDELAAWTGDANATADPVPFDAIDTDAAIKACYAATVEAPDIARYRFQLGRAFDRAALPGADTFLTEAAERGYAAARAYLDADPDAR